MTKKKTKISPKARLIAPEPARPIMECAPELWNGGKILYRIFPDDCVEPATNLEPAKVIKYKVEVLGPAGWFDGSIGDSFRSFDTLNEAYQYAETWDYETRVVEVEE